MTTPTDRVELTETQALLLKLARMVHAAQAWMSRDDPYAPHTAVFLECSHPDCLAARRLTTTEAA